MRTARTRPLAAIRITGVEIETYERRARAARLAAWGALFRRLAGRLHLAQSLRHGGRLRHAGAPAPARRAA